MDTPAETTRPWIVFAIVSTGVVLATLDQFIVNVAFAAIGHSLNGTVASLSWVLNGYSIVFAALLIPAGRFADRSGRKLGFLLGVAIFTLASAACAAASTLDLLIAARVVQAAGAALLVPSSLGLLLAAYPEERRAGAVRAWGAVTGASAALGPVLGGLLVTASWRWIFLVNLPVGIVAIVAGARLLPRAAPERGPLPDLLGAALMAVGIGALSLGLVKAQAWGWSSARTVGAFVAAAVVTAVFLWRSSRHPSPLVELSLLRVRRFALAAVAMTVYSAAFASMLLSIALWAETGWHWSALRFGLAFAPGPLMVPLISPQSGRLIRAIGAGATAAIGCVVFAAGALSWIALVGRTPQYASALLPGSVLCGIGVALTLPTLIAAGSTSLPPQRFATGSAVLSMARQLGFTLGVAVVVAVIGNPRSGRDQLIAFRHGWIATAALGAIAAAVAIRLIRRVPATAVVRTAAVEET